MAKFKLCLNGEEPRIVGCREIRRILKEASAAGKGADMELILPGAEADREQIIAKLRALLPEELRDEITIK